MLNVKIGNSWDDFLQKEYTKLYYQKLNVFIEKEYAEKTIYPPEEDIFNAFKYTPLSEIKVVILGQDPYHEKNQAHGLAFSTPEGNPIPRSLSNIFKEIRNEYGYKIPFNGCLDKWAKQGVFLLNTVLTVEESNANSHSKCGWQRFTDNVITKINKQNQPIVFMLWGKQAEKKKELLNNPNHLVLVTSHPSPFSARRGFLGSNHFKLANEFLKENNVEEIDWSL
ncbi:MAG: uracil-DNA glycosylase [Methanosphaera sp. rholeuAM130]|nr:uracil-DNA glycosylase [Methanosphaera sp.]RAP54629.1 MAG: uracil-DNA glycosylase [Methanosphaera sp. rholeuAM130]